MSDCIDQPIQESSGNDITDKLGANAQPKTRKIKITR